MDFVKRKKKKGYGMTCCFICAAAKTDDDDDPFWTHERNETKEKQFGNRKGLNSQRRVTAVLL